MSREEEAARKLLEHRAGRTPLPVGDWRASGLAPQDETAGYAVQQAVEALRTAQGDRRIGYKIGATNAAAREFLSVKTPFYGRLYDGSSSVSPAQVAFRQGIHLVMEPEIAVEIARDLDPAEAPFDAAGIEAATRSLRPAIELVATSLYPWLEAGVASLIADNAVHGDWIGGAPVTDWSGIDLMDGPVRVLIDGTETASGAGRAVDGGCFGAAAWLANRLARDGIGLKAGEIITTGTVTPPVPVGPGQTVVADFGALGRVELELGG